MKTAEVQTKVLKGNRLIVGTFQGEEVREVKSKKDGHSMWFHTAFVLNSREMIAVGLPTDASAKRKEEIKELGYKDGQPVVHEFTHIEKTQYGVRSRGALYLLEA